mmetsp:Transcript_8465/g.12408  ORF Transcript_8465/g.12408 Transcript_8465/m.12408 type:complete len:219 (-) Transcript_8465:68-724(-)
MYSSLASLPACILLRITAFWWRLRCKSWGVMRRWILGALDFFFLSGQSRRTTNLRTSSFLSKLKSFRMWLARLGPNLRGSIVSVKPSMSASPFFTMSKFMTARSGPTMQPRTDFRLRQPLRRSRKQDIPFLKSNLTRLLVRTPCFMGKPCLSLPPEIRRTYPLNSSPKQSPSTSVAIRLSKKGRSLLSSSNSKTLCWPVAGLAIINFMVEGTRRDAGV